MALRATEKNTFYRISLKLLFIISYCFQGSFNTEEADSIVKEVIYFSTPYWNLDIITIYITIILCET